MIYSLLGISWATSGSTRDEIWVWNDLSGRRKQTELIPVTIFWVVWNERNKRAFDEVDDAGGFNLLNNRWFQTLSFFFFVGSLSSFFRGIMEPCW